MLDSNPNPDPVPETDLRAQHKAHERKEMLAAGMLALSNLFLRSVCTLAVLYGIRRHGAVRRAQLDRCRRRRPPRHRVLGNLIGRSPEVPRASSSASGSVAMPPWMSLW